MTGHDSSGNAVIIKDSEIECQPTPIKCNFAVLWETSTFPSDNNDDQDPAKSKTQSLVNENGVILRVVDFPPRTETVSAPLSSPADRSRLSYLGENNMPRTTLTKDAALSQNGLVGLWHPP